MKLEIFTVVVFSIAFILATIFRAKTDAIIQEFERVTKRCMTPNFYKYQSLTYISIMLWSIAIGVLFMLLV